MQGGRGAIFKGSKYPLLLEQSISFVLLCPNEVVRRAQTKLFGNFAHSRSKSFEGDNLPLIKTLLLS
jgi:hypothetical protein